MNILMNKILRDYNFNHPKEKMQIFLHHLDGSTEVVGLDRNSSVEGLLEKCGLEDVRLVNEGSFVNELATLKQGANVYVTGGLEGGKRKKKKKVYTTKKKNKHIHKRIKLLPLTNYGVDAKGNITLQRKTCPFCGAGIFMAQHWDRYYCGHCHTTIKMDAETVKKNEEIMKKKRAALEAERKAREKEAADKAPAGKGKKDAKKKKKK
jgi:small subunit ribosomal protein S27Ae